MKNTVFFSLVVVLLAEGVRGQEPTLFQADTIRAVGEFLNRISQDIDKIQHTRLRLVAEYDSLANVISHIKVSRELNFLRRMRLKRLLRQSEEMALQIGKLNKVYQLQADIVHAKIRPAILLMEGEIEERIAEYRRSINDSVRAQITLMLRERARMLRMIKPESRYGRLAPSDFNVEADATLKAEFALDLSDRLSRHSGAIDFELGRIQFAMRLRNAYFRVAPSLRLPPWFAVRGWIEPWLTDRQLEFSGYFLRTRDDLLVREFKLRTERNLIQDQHQRWMQMAHEWERLAEAEDG